MKKCALITGILGQDGAYLARFLLQKGYEVFGGHRQSSSMNTWRLDELGVVDDVHFVPVDLLDLTNVLKIIEQIQPNEVYNLAAQSSVSASFKQPISTSEVGALGAARILEALRSVCPECCFYQASTSEMFGKPAETPQRERTSFYPRSPYAISRLYAHWITVNYRETYGMHTASGILFNHESPLRGIEFVTRKITHGVAKIRHGNREVLELGNLESRRDWGFAGDYVKGMWMMLQQAEGDDYVLATGENHSVREFIDRAAEAIGFKLDWQGEADQTEAIDRESGRLIIRINPEFYRPAEVDMVVGDSSKARKKLGWKPEISFNQLVEMMVMADMDRVAKM